MFRMILLFAGLAICVLTVANISGQESKKIAQVPAYIIKYYTKKAGDCVAEANSDACATVTISYPKFSATLGAQSAEQLNHYIEASHITYVAADDSKAVGVIDFAQKFIDDYLDYIKDDQGTSGNWEQSKKIRVIFLNTKVLSLQDDEDGYTGGAHGFSNTRLLSLDLNSGVPLKLNDILLEHSKKKLLKIAEHNFRKLHNLSAKISLEKAGFDFDKNQFSLSENFAVLKQGVLFYYNSYEIAAYVVGATRLFIPYEVLVGVVDTQRIGL